MGYAKSLLMEQQERGYSSVGDKYVCKKCIGNKYIQEFIQENLESHHCDYCNTTKKSLIAAELDKVIGFILDGINTEWDHPINCMGWDEGKWTLNTTDSYDLIREELGDDLQIENDQLNQDIINAIIDNEWCERNPYSLRPYDQDYYSWERFSDLTKYNIRYVFYRTENSDDNDPDNIGEPYEILDRIGSLVSHLELINILPKGTQFYRGRTHKSNENFTDVKNLGPPPNDKAKSNRMSPAGIVMFYGSFEQKTAISETSDKNPFITVAAFNTLRELTVLDLTKLPDIPSLFDESRRHLRNGIFFLNKFIENITQPISRDGLEHIEYVPTQIVTEYFRHIYHINFDKKIDGIIYPSSHDINEKNCVLFIDQEKCTQDNLPKSDKKCLCLLTGTIQRIKLRCTLSFNSKNI